MLKFHFLHPDWTTILSAALPASLLLLALCIFVLSFTLRRGHRTHRAELARIFEQLDLLRFDAQQSAMAEVAVPGAPGTSAVTGVQAALELVGSAGDYYAAAQLAARGSSAAEIANRCGIVNGEARVLVALQQARARRTSH
jgi:hypothetical protein